MGKRRRPPEWHPLHSPSKSAKAVARREAEQKAAADVAAKMARRDCLFGSWYLRDRRRKKVAKEVPLDNQGDRVVDLCSDENEAQAAEGFWEALAGDDDFVCCKEWCNEHYGSDEDGDVERFSPQLVSDFRRYYYGLPPQDRADFVAARTYLPDGKKFRRARFIESPSILRESLNRLRTRFGGFSGRLMQPRREHTIEVCGTYFRFLLGYCKMGIIETRSGSVIKGKHKFQREGVKKQSALHWLHGIRTQHLVSPTKDMTILPWGDKVQTHAAYVEEIELALQCPWAKEAARPQGPSFYDESEDVEHLSTKDLPSIPGEEEAKTQAASSFRYGNKLCGLKGVHPEHPDIASLKWFCEAWINDEEAVKCVVRRHIPFSKCDECVTTREAIRDTRDLDERDRLRKKHRTHISSMNKERGVYWAHRHLARLYPKQHLSLCIDGADQSDHSLPHVHEKTHTSGEAHKAKVHVTGVIAHGRDTYVYTCPFHVKFGHNMAIQALWDTIVDIQARSADGKLPDNLYIQLDNTTRQNKGRYFTAFCEYLVAAGLFKYVGICFLPVGHTHEDIDQFFSRIAIRLRKYDAWSRQQLAHQIRECYTSKEGRKPRVFHWSSVANISGWMRGWNADGSKSAHRIDTKAQGWMQYRHLRIVPGDEKGTARVYLRHNMADKRGKGDPWSGLDRSKEYHQGLKTTPGVFFDALKNATIPAAQRAGVTEGACQKREAGLAKIKHVYGDRFQDEAYHDCLAMLHMEQDPSDIPFHWDAEGIDAMKDLVDAYLQGRDDEGAASDADDEVRAAEEALVSDEDEGAVIVLDVDDGESELERAGKELGARGGLDVNNDDAEDEDGDPYDDPWWMDEINKAKDRKMVEGSFWIIKPSMDEDQNPDHLPFWLARVVSISADKEDHPVPGAYVKYWVPKFPAAALAVNAPRSARQAFVDSANSDFFLDAKYGEEYPQPPDGHFVPFGLRAAHAFQEVCKMGKGTSSTSKTIAKRGNVAATDWIKAVVDRGLYNNR